MISEYSLYWAIKILVVVGLMFAYSLFNIFKNENLPVNIPTCLGTFTIFMLI